MHQQHEKLPIVRSLPDDVCLAELFSCLSRLPGCLWLDSASRGPRDPHGQPIGRYSFLTADPVQSLVAFAGDSDNDGELVPTQAERRPSASKMGAEEMSLYLRNHDMQWLRRRLCRPVHT